MFHDDGIVGAAVMTVKVVFLWICFFIEHLITSAFILYEVNFVKEVEKEHIILFV